jgi:hypothetical protein
VLGGAARAASFAKEMNSIGAETARKVLDPQAGYEK